MEHKNYSVEGYLQRKSTEELRGALNMIFLTGREQENVAMIREIQKVLQEREKIAE